MARDSKIGTVYLLHFSKKFHHCQHYIGFALHLEARIRHHRAGTGARLMRAVVRAGIDFQIARTWVNVDRRFERKLKKQKKARCLCPICRAELAAIKNPGRTGEPKKIIMKNELKI